MLILYVFQMLDLVNYQQLRIKLQCKNHSEMEIEGYRWQDLERMAQHRTRWMTVVSGLCTTKQDQRLINGINGVCCQLNKPGRRVIYNEKNMAHL